MEKLPLPYPPPSKGGVKGKGERRFLGEISQNHCEKFYRFF
jgi:hypothetical protein